MNHTVDMNIHVYTSTFAWGALHGSVTRGAERLRSLTGLFAPEKDSRIPNREGSSEPTMIFQGRLLEKNSGVDILPIFPVRSGKLTIEASSRGSSLLN